MTLQSLLLDDLRWRDMVEVIRGRIAGVSGEEWTLHAPVDPGVTLIELLAAELEQRSFWLDQLPDSLINGLIALLGASRHPARAATTVLELQSAVSTSIPADSVFQVAGGGPELRMATRDPIDLLRIEQIDLVGGFGKRSTRSAEDSNWALQPLALLSAGGRASGLTITLWLKLAPLQGQTIALLLELEEAAGILPGWDSEAADDVPPPAVLTWSHSANTVSGRKRFDSATVSDDTQGLRRSGIVRIEVPGNWVPSGPPNGDLKPYTLWLETAAATFSFPPLLRRIVPNAVVARHAIPVEVPANLIESRLAQWLPLPGNVIDLPDVLPPLEDTVKLALRGRDEVWRDWHVASDFARFGPEDPVLQVDRKLNRIAFGDGLTGRLPVPSRRPSTPLTVRYRAGGGEIGQVGSNLLWECDDPSANANNPVPGSGGREAESAADARDRIGAELFKCQRAVTLPDYESLAVSTPGVGVRRAHASSGAHPGFPCLSVHGAVGVIIVPDAPRLEGWQTGPRRVDRPQPDPGMLRAVRTRLDAARLLTAEVYVSGPAYRGIELDVALRGAPFDVTAMNSRLTRGVAAFLDALVGGSAGQGWPFGQPVRPSELAHVLQVLAGSDAVVERVLARFAGSTGGFSECDDLEIGPNQLVVLDAIRLRWTMSVDPQGGLS